MKRVLVFVVFSFVLLASVSHAEMYFNGWRMCSPIGGAVITTPVPIIDVSIAQPYVPAPSNVWSVCPDVETVGYRYDGTPSQPPYTFFCHYFQTQLYASSTQQPIYMDYTKDDVISLYVNGAYTGISTQGQDPINLTNFLHYNSLNTVTVLLIDSADLTYLQDVRFRSVDQYAVYDPKLTSTPEPSSCVVLFAGLGLVGKIVRKRIQK